MKVTYVLRSPQHHHTLEQASSAAGAAQEQVKVRASDAVRRLIRHLETELGRGDFKESHLTANIVESTDQEIHHTVRLVKLTVRHHRQSKLGQHIANEPDVATRIMCILHQPLC